MTMNPEPNYRFAGFWWRFLALLIDQFVLMIVGGIAGLIIGITLAVFGWKEDGIQAFSGMFGFLWSWLYYALCESSAWRATPGKKACGLIVTGENGERISFGRATGRYFAKILSSLILLIGFMMAGWTRRKQALHDIICGTLVLKKVEASMRVEVPRAA
jgi:uncharacterized RDD family membrane protein YckC